MNNATTPSTILLDHDGPVTHLKLNRPEKLNAFDASVVEQAIAAIAEAEERGSRLLVISGEGRSFSAGFDLSDLDRQTDSDLVLRFIRIETLLQAIHNAPMATLALVHGRCFGAAADLFCVCHHRVAAPDTTFRMPGLRFGIVLGTRRVSRLIGAEKARDVLETSKTINADEALGIGMVQHVAPIERWPDFIGDRAGAAGALDPAAQARLLKNTRTSSDDADLADLVRSASVPGLADRIRNFAKGSR